MADNKDCPVPAQTWNNAQLVMEDVALWRGEQPLVAGLSLRLQGGDAVALIGPNGSGKTSLLRVLAGLAEPSAGTLAVQVEGVGADLPRSALVHLGGHQDGLKGALSVRENLAFWARYYGDEGSTIAAALAQLDVAHLIDLPAAILSQGQKRRVALARLLVARRPIWLLDEPTAALDRASTAKFLAVVEQHREAGGIVVAATHADLALADVKRLDLSDYPAFGAAGGSASVDHAHSYWLEDEDA